ncbi:MAG TPA: hypothetical protein VHN20_08485 [Beijerinckiaceae bacterium]|nr:hypothetical protein [Beijerinckiaceae bacterium]
MSKACSRGLRRACFGLLSASAIAASGIQFSPPSFGPEPAVGSISLGLASAQIPSFEEGMKRATAGLGQAGAVTLENLAFEVGFTTYRIPKVEISGTNLSQAELTALLGAASNEPAGSRFSRLSAREAKIPELRIEQSFAGARGAVVYHDVVARDIVNGRIGSLTSARATLEFTAEHLGDLKATAGRTSLDGLDLPHAAAVFAPTAGAGRGEMKTMYGAFAMEGFAMSGPEGVEVRIPRMSGSGVKARPIGQALNTYVTMLARQPDLEKLPPAERSKLIDALAELYEGFDLGAMEMANIEIRNPGAKPPAVGRIGRVAFSGAGTKPADLRAEGIEIVAENGKARVATIAVTGFSYRPTIAGLKSIGDKPVEKIDAADMRRLIPTLGTIRVSGLDLDVPNTKTPGAENIRLGLKDMEITADKPLNGIPTNSRIAFENLTFAIPADAQEDGLKELLAMGYRALDISLATAASWNEPGGEIVMQEFSVRGSNMGSAALRAVVGNVGKDVFDVDPAVAMVALVGATARNLELRVENNGLFERLLAQQAKKQGKSADDLRREYGVAAAAVIPALLGNSSNAKSLGQALGRFIAKPGRLTISARARDAAGIGLTEFIAAPDPAAILEKLEITATVE